MFLSGTLRLPCRTAATMRFLDLTLPTAVENLALDEALLLEAEAGRGGEVLRLWEWPAPVVVLGAGGVVQDDVDEAACTADGVSVLRRSSGGGTVLLGRGCLCYSLVLAYDRAPGLDQIRASYRWIFERMQEVFARLLPGVEPAGISDLAVAGRKFSGNAQQRKRHHFLHHGTLLHDFDLALLPRYLRSPKRQPDYREQRRHEDFLMNVPCSVRELKARLREVWQADEEMTTWPEEMVRRLVAEQYTTEEWIQRR